MSNEVWSCCLSICNLRPACFAHCSPFFVHHLVTFEPERHYLWYHFWNWRFDYHFFFVGCCPTIWLDAVGSEQRGSNLIGCCACSSHTHTNAHRGRERARDAERLLKNERIYILIFVFYESSKSFQVTGLKSKWSHESLLLKSKSSCKSFNILSSRV